MSSAAKSPIGAGSTLADKKPPPRSCDTFVVVAKDSASHTVRLGLELHVPTVVASTCRTLAEIQSHEQNGWQVFGKNSDRPNTEVHEVSNHFHVPSSSSTSINVR